MHRSKVYAVIAGLAVIAAATATKKKRKSLAPPKKKIRALPAPEGWHVGTPGWEWPLPERFKEVGSFPRALRSLGYEVPRGDVLSDETKSVVAAFKLDYNVVTRQDYLGPELDDSGFLTDEAVQALASAVDRQRAFDRDWFLIVGDALKAARPEVG